MSKPLVTVITGNSNSGSACIEELYARYGDKVNVRGAFRSEEKAVPFRQKYPHLDVFVGVDAGKPETMKAAFAGAERALIVVPYDPTRGFAEDGQFTVNMINAAAENGVKYIVVVASFTGRDVETMSILANRDIPAQEVLAKLNKEKNILWTVLCGGFFMENTLNMFKNSIKESSTINLANVHFPMVATSDIGKSGAACLAAGDIRVHHGKYYDMNGPELLSGADVARIFSKVLGREIKWNEMTPEMVKKHVPLPIAQIYEWCFKNPMPFTQDVKNLTGQNRTLENFLKEHIQAFQ